MTDEELKELVASLAVDQKELSKKMAQTDEQMKHTDEQIKLTHEQMKRTDEQMKRTDEQMKRTDEQMKRTDEKLERIGITLGNIGRNQGEVAEEFFFNSLIENTHLGSIHFDDITRNDTKHRGKIQEEYDLFMTNGDAVGIIEVKYKAHESDLDKLERKMGNFKKLYPKYDDCKIYGALATFHINEDLKKATLERGFFILQQRGELVHTECGENLKIM